MVGVRTKWTDPRLRGLPLLPSKPRILSKKTATPRDGSYRAFFLKGAAAKFTEL